MTNLQNIASHRAVLENALVKAVAQLVDAASLMEEMAPDYHTADHQRWEVAYRWVVTTNELIWIARVGLLAFDMVTKEGSTHE